MPAQTLRQNSESSNTFSQGLTAARGSQPFVLSPLPYAMDALEPVIDRETLLWHYDVHHRSCVDKLNDTLKDSSVHGLTLDEILARVSRFPKAVRAHGGGHWNHTFFWNSMTDVKENQEFSPELLHAFELSYGSLDDFKTHFINSGTELHGSGWMWLMRTAQGRLKIITTPNNDNPTMDFCEVSGKPILVCDLWEHAYYLKFKANRAEFIRKFLAIVNWARVHSLFVNEPTGKTH